MGSFYDGKNGSLKEKNNIEVKGNTDTKILAKAFEGFTAQGLTNAAIETIEKLDDILKGADIVISKDRKTAAIVQDDGQSFSIEASKTSTTKRTR